MKIAEITGLEFSSQGHAYGSIFHLLSWFVSLVRLAAVVMAGMVVYWSLRIRYTARRHVPVDNVGLPW